MWQDNRDVGKMIISQASKEFDYLQRSSASTGENRLVTDAAAKNTNPGFGRKKYELCDYNLAGKILKILQTSPSSGFKMHLCW